ncbi:MAG: ComEC/Rec2 family competence protein, partial [Parafilimonas sp.]
MPSQTKIPAKNFPFLRLVFALTAGIIMQWYFGISIKEIILFTVIVFVLIIAFYTLSSSKKFILGWLRGIFILLLFACVGMLATWQQNIHNNVKWYGRTYDPADAIIITIMEPLVEKPNSYKAIAEVIAVYKNKSWVFTEGNILLYFKKDSVKPSLQYGSQIVFNKPLQQIQNNGNPAALDYNRYCLFQSITSQVFLTTKDYNILSSKNTNTFQKFLFAARDWALNTLKQNIHSPKELGIAEALLIGYRNDLDKDLVQAYSNTGVVHIIAISGLHIGVIYGALIMFFSLFKSSKIKKWIAPVIILCVIWLFTLVAGAAPSVLRAAGMFTFILAGKFLGKNGNIYNTLAASAFVLLISNPFYLWDVGFQLSYAAVFSIVVFFKSINGLLYFKNRSLRWIWQLCSISLSAQIFTLPLVIYHFHQLPLLFLFTNLFVVPLSGVVLIAELILFAFSFWHAAASLMGIFTETCIRWMNDFVEQIDKLSFSVWDGLHISIIQLVIMFAIICFISLWIFNKNTKTFISSLSCIILFFISRDADIFYHRVQQKIIVYNVPKQSVVDIIAGNTYRFAGDSIVLKDAFLRNFNLKPSRVKNRVYN